MAGLDFGVKASPLLIKSAAGSQEVHGYQAVTRVGDGKVLSIVNGRFDVTEKLFQDAETLVGHGCQFRSAGSLDAGRQLFVQLAVNSYELVPEEIIENRVVLFDCHDASQEPYAILAPVRVASGGINSFAEARVQLSRDSGIWDDAADFKADCDFFADFRLQAEQLVKTRFSAAEMFTMVRKLLPAADENDVPTRTANNRLQLLELFAGGSCHEANNIVATRWGALQAVVEYVDRWRGTRVKGDDDAATRRLESSLFGSGARLKQNAFNYLYVVE